MSEFKRAIEVKELMPFDQPILNGEYFNVLMDYYHQHYAQELIFFNGCIGFIKRKTKGANEFVVNFINENLNEQTI